MIDFGERGRWSGKNSACLAAKQRLVYRQLAAGAPDDVVRGAGFHELKSVAEGISLAHHGVNVNLPERERKLQPHDFANRHFHPQDGGNSRFADVDGLSLNHSAITRIDGNTGF